MAQVGSSRGTSGHFEGQFLGRSAGFPTWLSFLPGWGNSRRHTPLECFSSPDASRPRLPRKEYRPQSCCRLASKRVRLAKLFWACRSHRSSADEVLPQQRSSAAGQTLGVPKPPALCPARAMTSPLSSRDKASEANEGSRWRGLQGVGQRWAVWAGGGTRRARQKPFRHSQSPGRMACGEGLKAVHHRLLHTTCTVREAR